MHAAELVVSLVFASTINIRPALIQTSSNAGVRAACNGAVDTACTRFDGTTLSCDCALDRGRWSPAVRIDAQPRMYLSHNMYLLHELAHVFDFRSAMVTYAAELERETFSTSSSCTTFVSEMRLGFGGVLLDFHRASMLRRDHQLADRK
jgi:hypothetical protein